MRASRVLLPAAAQLCGLLFLSGPALATNASSVWSSLWRTPDQQGQALLDSGQPAQAAQRFQDPRRRAYADLQSGGYSGAAKLLAPFTDAQSEYNRGNALAKSGQLQAALAAYDSALKQAPADKDIRHNRDLVARALQQQQQQQKQSPQSSSHNGRQGNQGNRGSQGGSSQGQQPQSSANGKQGSPGSQQSGSQQSGGASQQSRAGSQSTNSNQASQANQPTSGGSQTGPNANQPGNSSQAQREAADAAALARAQRQRGAAGKSPGTDDSLLSGGSQTPKQKPETERQMALDQWLRQIPDTPAGLLRRKFLIEHMIRQQDSGGSPESAQ